MKIILLVYVLLITSFPSHSDSTVTEGKETDRCFSSHQHSHEAINCVYDSWLQSNKKLEAIVITTSDHIKKNPDYSDPFNEGSELTSGDIYQKRFLDSQKTWEKYKQQYCLAIMAPIDTDGFDYQRSLEQCEINMNQRRIEEIALMGESSTE